MEQPTTLTTAITEFQNHIMQPWNRQCTCGASFDSTSEGVRLFNEHRMGAVLSVAYASAKDDWRVEYMHDDCPDCEHLADMAVTQLKLSGDEVATHQQMVPDQDTPTLAVVGHSATAIRQHPRSVQEAIRFAVERTTAQYRVFLSPPPDQQEIDDMVGRFVMEWYVR